MSTEEITVTLVSPSGQSESISVGASSTTVKDLQELAVALFGLAQPSPLAKDGKPLDTFQTLAQAGIRHGDLVAVVQPPAAAPRPAASSGLDFSNLLSSAPAPAPAASGGGLDFSNLLGSSTSSTQPRPPVYWEGMSLNDAMAHNPHPQQFVTLVRQHESLWKELNHHQPILAQELRQNSPQKAVEIWRETCVKGGIRNALQHTQSFHQERDMKLRLEKNPNDVEAKAYFDKQRAQQEIQSQYIQMMNNYPESMGRVLMLYISAKVNDTSIQAFVDSGAQTTIMSKKCAAACGILHLVDERFAGTAVGVGTGKILGRIHLVNLTIHNHYFPCTVTVMDDGGMGDKNMDFLLGLDMLKRHLCKIDLEAHCLKFKLSDTKYMEAPFLHEKDLDESKGGTKGFDANKANEEILKRMEEYDDDDKKDGDDKMKE